MQTSSRSPGGTRLSYAAIRNIDDEDQWEQAAEAIRTLKALNQIQLKYEKVLVGETTAAHFEVPTSLADVIEAGNELGALSELAGDISLSLRALPQIHEEWMSELLEAQRALLQVAKSMDATLRDMADTLASALGRND